VAARQQRAHILTHILHAVRERERSGHIRAVLGGMVAVADEGKAHFGLLPLSDAADNAVDVLLCGTDIGPHGHSAVTHEAEVQLGGRLAPALCSRVSGLARRLIYSRWALLADNDPVARCGSAHLVVHGETVPCITWKGG